MSPAVLAVLDQSHIPILLVIGFAVLAGSLGARVFQWMHIPQVVGYIIIGMLVGRTGLNLINQEAIDSLLPFNFFALGIIGFMIGGELRREVFRRYGKQFLIILFAEGTGAFVAVSVIATGVMQIFLHDWAQACAFGLVLGAIASATAPAATVDVLWEYKTRGVLTTTVFAIVALDDGLALVLFSIASSIAMKLTGQTSMGFVAGLGHTAYELLGAVILGAVAGVLLNLVLRLARDHDKALAFTVGGLALVLGLSLALGVDVILAAMALGMTLANVAPHRSQKAFATMAAFAPPIYVLFFVIVGARLSLGNTPGWIWAVALAYIAGRTAGKMLGANLGARWAGAAESVRKYLGLTLFSQAGVAIGLAILASVRFSGDMGNAIIMIVTATTFVVQIIGPPCVKAAVSKAGEIGLNITEEDLMETYTVGDVMDASVPTFAEATTLKQMLDVIASTDALVYPVTDAEQHLTGVITIQDLKVVFNMQDLTDFMVAYDVMQPVSLTVSEATPLTDAMAAMGGQGLDHMLVVASDDPDRLVGLLDQRAVRRRLSQEILNRRARADAA